MGKARQTPMGDELFGTKLGELRDSSRSAKEKRSGSEVGYPSESVPRAVWRHLADRYNNFDSTVCYEPSGYARDFS